jgi:hypothetical protein
MIGAFAPARTNFKEGRLKMKTLKWIALSVFLALALYPARAQSNEMHLQVPFSFVVSGKMLPAGDYVMERASDTGVLMITGISNGYTVAVTSSPGSMDAPYRRPAATFGATGGTHYLEEVHLGGEPSRVIPQPSLK